MGVGVVFLCVLQSVVMIVVGIYEVLRRLEATVIYTFTVFT